MHFEVKKNKISHCRSPRNANFLPARIRCTFDWQKKKKILHHSLVHTSFFDIPPYSDAISTSLRLANNMFHGLLNLFHQECETHVILMNHFTKFLVYSRTPLQFRTFPIKNEKILVGFN